eukprot:363797-Chlamydomonas_euryale.AAC.3
MLRSSFGAQLNQLAMLASVCSGKSDREEDMEGGERKLQRKGSHHVIDRSNAADRSLTSHVDGQAKVTELYGLVCHQKNVFELDICTCTSEVGWAKDGKAGEDRGPRRIRQQTNDSTQKEAPACTQFEDRMRKGAEGTTAAHHRQV